MSIIGVYKAQFAFSANSPQELTIAEGDLLYLFDKGDDGWWTCKKRVPGAANEEPTGLVPHNFVAPAQPEGPATALYAYEAQTTEEISFPEAAPFDVYAQDGDWVLVGSGQKFGFVPANYIQTGSSAPPLPKKDFLPPPKHPNASTATPSPAPGGAASRNGSVPDLSASGGPSVPPVAASTKLDTETPPPMPKRPGKGSSDGGRWDRSDRKPSSSRRRRSFSVHNVDRRSSSDIVIDPEHFIVDSKKWSYKDILSYSTEKKHLFIELENPRASFDFRTETRDVAEQILASIAGMAGAHRGGGGLTEVFVAAKSAGNKSARVSIDFVAANGREVTVKEGELVFVLDKSNKEWWLVRNQSGAEGMLPSHIVELEEEKTRSLWPFKKSSKKEKEPKEQEYEYRGRDDSRGHRASRIIEHRRADRDRGDRDTYERDQGDQTPAREQSVRRSNSKSKPDMRKVRTWTDRGANFRVEAALLGCADGKIHLHKQNGVKIAVPANKLCTADLDYVESVTGISLNEDKPLVDKIDKRSSRSKGSSGSSGAAPSNAAPPSELSPNGFDWFEFFLACGIEPQSCQRYAVNFSRDRMDEATIPVLTPQILRNLGLKEGDILRVTKKIREKFPSDEDTWVSRDTAKSVSPAPVPAPAQVPAQAAAPAAALQPQQTAAAQHSVANPISSQPTGALADLLGLTSLEPSPQQQQKQQQKQTALQQQEELAARQRALRAAQDQLADQKHEAERKMLEAQRTAQSTQQRQILEQQANLQKQQVELLKRQQDELRKQQEDYIQVQRTGQSIRASLGPFATGVAQQSTGNFGNFGASAAATLGQSSAPAPAPFQDPFAPISQFVPVQNQQFAQQTTGTPFGQQTTGGPFARQTTGSFGQQTTGGPFGQQTTGNAPFRQQTTGGPFGQTTGNAPFQPVAPSQPFSQQPTGNAPFGQQITGGGFTNATLFQPQQTGPFGQPVAAQKTGPFGQAAPAPAAPFGLQQQPASDPFKMQQQQTGPFGQQPQPVTSQRTGPFGTQQTGGLSSQQTGPFGQNFSSPAVNQPKTDPFGEIFRQYTGNKSQAPTLSQVRTGNAFQPQVHQAAAQPFQQHQFTAQPFQQTGLAGEVQQPFQPVQQQFQPQFQQPIQQQVQQVQPQRTGGFQPQSQFGQQLQNQPLQSQPTGFGFGNQPQGANYNQASAANPFGL